MAMNKKSLTDGASLEPLLKDVHLALDHLQPDDAALRAQAARLRAAIESGQVTPLPPQPSPAAATWRRPGTLGAAGALLAAAAAVLIVWGVTGPGDTPSAQDPEAIRCLTEQGEQIKEKDWLQAQPNTPLHMRFSDTSTMALTPSSRMAFETLGKRAVEARLESGQIKVHITPEGPRTWTIHTGPLKVVVLGTAFDLGWEPESQRMNLSVQKGRVAVLGAQIRGGRIEVEAGEDITIETRQPAKIERPVEPQPKPSEPEKTPEHQQQEPETTAKQKPRPKATPPRPPSWITLAKEGDYPAAWDAVQARGLERVRAKAEPAELILLADMARYGGHLQAAVETLEWLHRHHPDSATAPEALFRLGRIELDQRKRYKDAALWFSLYTRSHPQGRWHERALGLSIQAHQKAGLPQEARAAATRYLRTYPQGPYAKLAAQATSPTPRPK